jgi:hypothetical protein
MLPSRRIPPRMPHCLECWVIFESPQLFDFQAARFCRCLVCLVQSGVNKRKAKSRQKAASTLIAENILTHQRSSSYS